MKSDQYEVEAEINVQGIKVLVTLEVGTEIDDGERIVSWVDVRNEGRLTRTFADAGLLTELDKIVRQL